MNGERTAWICEGHPFALRGLVGDEQRGERIKVTYRRLRHPRCLSEKRLTLAVTPPLYPCKRLEQSRRRAFANS